MRSGAVQISAVCSGVVVAGRVLAWLTPGPAELAATLRHPQQAALSAGVDVPALAAASTACWLAFCWLVLALAASAGAALPGRCGKLADQVAAVTVPATARRLLAVTLGLTVVAGSTAAPAFADVLPQQRPAPSTLDLDWPVAGEPSAPRPAQAARKPSATGADDGSSERRPVVVRRGDSLWTIAQRHVPPGATAAQIAAEWPRWYSANRPVVGADPNLLLPGQRLVPPADPSGGHP